jgi:hypothetical protein
VKIALEEMAMEHLTSKPDVIGLHFKILQSDISQSVGTDNREGADAKAA